MSAPTYEQDALGPTQNAANMVAEPGAPGEIRFLDPSQSKQFEKPRKTRTISIILHSVENLQISAENRGSVEIMSDFCGK